MNGTNRLAVEINKHPYSVSTLDFALSLTLIGVETVRMTSAFPLITASSDVRDQIDGDR